MKDRITPIVIVVLILQLCGYVGCYYSLVQIGPQTADSDPSEPFMNEVFVVANYRVGGESAKVVFYPVNWVDRKIRCDAWKVQHVDPYAPIIYEAPSPRRRLVETLRPEVGNSRSD